jgi:hypothetical protein
VSTRLVRVNVRRSISAAALVLAAPVLSSCGSGFGAQTDQVYNPSAGVDDRSGAVDLTNVLVVSGEKGSGTVIANLVNNNQVDPDALKSVAGAGEDATLQVTPGGATTIPSGGMLNLASQGKVFVRGERIQAGYYVELTFTFDSAAPVTIDVPVVSATSGDYGSVPLPPATS